MTAAHPAGAGSVRHLRVVDERDARAAEQQAADAVREHALSLLAGRAKSRAELASALARRQPDESVVAGVLDRLTEVGLVDDLAYARAYAERESARRGPRAVADALCRRGIAPALAREVAFGADADDVRSTALAVGRAALPRWRGLEAAVVRRRLAALLARRGYDHGLVFAVTRELLDGAEGGNGERGDSELF